MERKNIAFPVNNEEHYNIKCLASNEGLSIKQLFLQCLEKSYPEWRNYKEKQNSDKQN